MELALPQLVPQLEAIDVLACVRVDELPVPNTHSFMSQCFHCNARIWVACSSPIEPKRMCVLCSTAYTAQIQK
jgi:hypothetical protein